jgi:hypothetical protein
MNLDPSRTQHKILKLWIGLLIPLSDLSAWQDLQFNKIKKNEVKVVDQKLHIHVNQSASPLIYALPEAPLLSGFKISATLKDFNLEVREGWKEDYPLRLGLVIAGDKTISGPKKFFAPDWMKKLFSLAKEGQGVDRIAFFNWSPKNQKVGDHRIHPKTDLMSEEIMSVEAGPKLSLSHSLSTPSKVLAIWLSVDGDDEKLKYSLELEKIELLGP